MDIRQSVGSSISSIMNGGDWFSTQSIMEELSVKLLRVTIPASFPFRLADNTLCSQYNPIAGFILIPGTIDVSATGFGEDLGAGLAGRALTFLPFKVSNNLCRFSSKFPINSLFKKRVLTNSFYHSFLKSGTEKVFRFYIRTQIKISRVG